jgi:hypothetical protein
MELGAPKYLLLFFCTKYPSQVYPRFLLMTLPMIGLMVELEQRCTILGGLP